MPETPEETYARALAAAEADVRLPLPPVEEWDTFPFEGDIRVREPPRVGAGGADCWRCEHGDEDAIWSDRRWLVAPTQHPTGLPLIVIVFPRVHVDFGDLDEEQAGELGRFLVRAERAVAGIPGVGRVHVCRWGDGSEHLHFWLMARPTRLPQVKGSFVAIWDDILPPLPEELWRENLAIVAHALAAGGGTAHV